MQNDKPTPPVTAFLAILRAAPARQQAFVFLCLLLCITFLPFGRRSGGGPWKPIAVDSGLLFRERPAVDFFCVYEAGARLLHGIDPFTVNAVSADPIHNPPLRAPYVATFRYPPLAAIWLGAPLNLLPPWWSYRAWVLLNFAMLIANFALCVTRRPGAMALQALVWFAWFPLQVEWYMGQFSVLMATLMLWSADALVQGRCGCLPWGLSLSLKTYTLCWAPALWFWKRRGIMVTWLVLVLGSTALWFALLPQSRDYFIERGIGGRIIGGARQPYAGSQGIQELVRAITWELQGRRFSMPATKEMLPPPLRDPVFLVNGALIGIYALLCVAGTWRRRHAPHAGLIGILWLSWFVAYGDCWEHHGVLLQGLLGFWLATGVMSPRLVLLCWLFAATPSLWIPFAGAMQSGHHERFWGLLYFAQRPVAYFLAMAVGVRSVFAEKDGVPR